MVDSRVSFPALIAVLLAAGFPSPSPAAGDPSLQCQARKVRIAARLYACLADADSGRHRDLDFGEYSAAAADCRGRFRDAWDKVEAKAVALGGSCPSVGEFPAVSDFVSTGVGVLGQANSTRVYPESYPQCLVDVDTCGEELAACDSSLATCTGSAPPPTAQVPSGAGATFVDMGDGTVLDTHTELMWQKLGGDGTPANGPAHAGYTDWRLPTALELYSLTVLGPEGPVVDPVFDNGCEPGCSPVSCSCSPADYYESSTSEPRAISTFLWGFWLVGRGEIRPDLPAGRTSGVRLVRGGSITNTTPLDDPYGSEVTKRNRIAGRYANCYGKAYKRLIERGDAAGFAEQVTACGEKAASEGERFSYTPADLEPVLELVGSHLDAVHGAVAGGSFLDTDPVECPGAHTQCVLDAARCESDLADCGAGMLAAAGRVLRTGQDRCTDGEYYEISCVGADQDGEFRTGERHKFRDNGDGTVSDLATGLTWEKIGDDGDVHDKDDTYHHLTDFPGNEPADKIAELNAGLFGGHDDWRLPSPFELASLLNFADRSLMAYPEFSALCSADCDVLDCSCTMPDVYAATGRFYVDFGEEGGLRFVPAVPVYPWLDTFHVRAVRSGV